MGTMGLCERSGRPATCEAPETLGVPRATERGGARRAKGAAAPERLRALDIERRVPGAGCRTPDGAERASTARDA